MAADMSLRFRDSLRKLVPPWLSDRFTSGLTVGFRFLWVMIAPLDVAIESLVQGIRAAWPGAGTPTALAAIGRSRGILRGQADTDDEYATRLRGWLDSWRDAGSSEELARQIHLYLNNRPRVRVVNRAGKWVTVETDGSVTRNQQAFGWDNVSHPERAGYWSEEWIIVYPDQWSTAGNWGAGDGQTWGNADLGFGHGVTRVEYDAIYNLITTWKSAHSYVRTVIFSSTTGAFDPTNPGSLPDGSWGTWETYSGGNSVPSRDDAHRYWERDY